MKICNTKCNTKKKNPSEHWGLSEPDAGLEPAQADFKKMAYLCRNLRTRIDTLFFCVSIFQCDCIFSLKLTVFNNYAA